MSINFFIIKTLSLLLYPLTQALILQVTALALTLRGRAAAGAAALALAVLHLAFFSMPPVAGWLINSLEYGYPPTPAAQMPQAEAIVLLGGAMRGAVPGADLGDLNQQADRVTYAAQLYQAGRAPLVIVTGGSFDDLPSEATLLADVLMLMGVPGSAMLLEERSRDTWDNAEMIAALLREQEVGRVLLVTSAFHMRRSAAVFEAAGVDFVVAPSDHRQLQESEVFWLTLPTVESLLTSTLAIHEHAGYWVYRVRQLL